MPIQFRAPGRPLTRGEIAARLEGIEGIHRALHEHATVDGVRWRQEVIPAGARVTLKGVAAPPLPELPTAPAYRVRVPAPPWPRGLWTEGEREVHYCVVERRAGLAEVRVEAPDLGVRRVADGLAQVGMPVAGDWRRGGLWIAGEPCIAIDGTTGLGPWPEEPLFLGGDRAGAPPGWSISKATARVVGGGHPWFLPDAETEPVERFRAGSIARAVSPGGRPVGDVLIEGRGKAAARLLTDAGRRGRFTGSLESRVDAALSRRRRLRERGACKSEHEGAPYTDTLRLIHGEADGLPGLFVDRFGPCLRALASSEGALHTLLPPVLSMLEEVDDPLVGPVEDAVVVVHLDRPAHGRHAAVYRWRAPLEQVTDPDRLWVHERGLRFGVDLGLGDPLRPRPGVGLFMDQRDNRHRLAKYAARGGAWLNLFAHTGAFSVSLLAAGAERVVSVDLSRRYLDWLDENLRANQGRGVDRRRHERVRLDGRRYLDALAPAQRFSGIVLDPPTAAAAGRRYWSVQRDLAPLVAQCLSRLEPGGALLVTHNHKRDRADLRTTLEAAAARVGVALERIDAAGPAPDFPRLRRFPEGDAFRGALAIRARI